MSNNNNIPQDEDSNSLPIRIPPPPTRRARNNNNSKPDEGLEMHSFVSANNLPKDPPTYDSSFFNNLPSDGSLPPPYSPQDINSDTSDIESLVPSWDQLPADVINPRRYFFSNYYGYDDFYEEDDYEYADYEEDEEDETSDAERDEEDFLLYHSEPSSEIQIFQQMDRHTFLRALSLSLSVLGAIISLYSCASFFTSNPSYEREYIQVCSSVQTSHRFPELCYADVYEKERADICYPTDVTKSVSLGEYPQTAILVLIFLYSVSGFSLFLSYWTIGCRQIDTCQGFSRFLELIALPLVLLLTLMAVWALQLLSENDFWKVVEFYWQDEKIDCSSCTWSTGNTQSNANHGVYSYYLIYNITAFSNARHNYTKESIDWNRDLYIEVKTDLERVLCYGIPCCIFGVLALFVSRWLERSRGFPSRGLFHRRRPRRRRRRNTSNENSNNNNSTNNNNNNANNNNNNNNQNSNSNSNSNSTNNNGDIVNNNNNDEDNPDNPNNQTLTTDSNQENLRDRASSGTDSGARGESDGGNENIVQRTTTVAEEVTRSDDQSRNQELRQDWGSSLQPEETLDSEIDSLLS